MKYAQQQENLDWKVIELSDENDPIIQNGNWYKLIEHEEPHDSWNYEPGFWSTITEIFPQHNLKHLHVFYHIGPGGMENPGPKLITEV
jgi:hypothetical protein